MFSDSRCKNSCKLLADLCPCFHQSPTRPNFLRTKLCPNFGRSRARLCPISFAPCPFPNLAGTLCTAVLTAGYHQQLLSAPRTHQWGHLSPTLTYHPHPPHTPTQTTVWWIGLSHGCLTSTWVAYRPLIAEGYLNYLYSAWLCVGVFFRSPVGIQPSVVLLNGKG